MKTRLLYSAVLAAALSVGVAQGDDTKKTDKSTDKSLGEKTSESIQKAGKTISDDTKKAATSVKNAVTGESPDARKVDVTLNERRVEMMREIPSGKTAFVVRNNGKERQNFKIEGQGLEKEFMIAVAPNDTKTLNVDLKPGDYKAFIPTSGKKEEGKAGEVNLKVK